MQRKKVNFNILNTAPDLSTNYLLTRCIRATVSFEILYSILIATLCLLLLSQFCDGIPVYPWMPY